MASNREFTAELAPPARAFEDERFHHGIHLLVVDLFWPSPRDPQGIHKAIWDSFCDEPFELPADKPLTAVAYFAGIPKTAYVEPLAVGDALPSLPLFLDSCIYVRARCKEDIQALESRLILWLERR